MCAFVCDCVCDWVSVCVCVCGGMTPPAALAPIYTSIHLASISHNACVFGLAPLIAGPWRAPKGRAWWTWRGVGKGRASGTGFRLFAARAGGAHPGVRSTCSRRKQHVARLLFEAAPNSSVVHYETTAERMERAMEVLRERERERESEREGRGFSTEDKLPLKCVQDVFFPALLTHKAESEGKCVAVFLLAFRSRLVGFA